MDGIVAAIARAHRLSPQETRILEAAARGQASKEVAFDLGISRRTVDCYWRHIFAKLGCRSQIEVLALLLARATGGRSRARRPVVRGTGVKGKKEGTKQASR